MEKLKDIYQELDAKTRALHLEDACDTANEEYVVRNLTESEINELKIEVANDILTENEARKALELAKEVYKRATLGLKDNIKENVWLIEKGYSESKEMVYGFFNMETRQVEKFDSAGLFLKSEPLSPNQQRKIKFTQSED